MQHTDIRGEGTGCLLWFNHVLYIRACSKGGLDIFVRMASSELGESRREAMEIELPLLSFFIVAKANAIFSLDNKLGEGEFGPVYKVPIAIVHGLTDFDDDSKAAFPALLRYLDAWAILKFHPKWDAPEQVDKTGDVPGATQEDLFGHDARPRPGCKPRPAKKTKSDVTASTDGSSASTQFGELIEQELRLKREAAKRAFEVQAEKDRTLMRLEELRFLATSTKDLDDADAYWIKKQKRLIRNKMRNDLDDADAYWINFSFARQHLSIDSFERLMNKEIHKFVKNLNAMMSVVCMFAHYCKNHSMEM
nr:G-type lectin S-receptor-like serine/threonine-protein kinase At4g27290 isoform X2 [Tanacetum cinerariifolium]